MKETNRVNGSGKLAGVVEAASYGGFLVDLLVNL